MTPTLSRPLSLTRRQRRGALAAVGALALCVPLVASFPGAASAASNRHVLPGSRPTWATKSHQGAVLKDSTALSVRVALAPRHAAAAEAFIAKVSDPSSKSYGHYLSPAQYTAKYGPSKAAVKRVSNYLRKQHIKVTSVAAGNQWVTARGTAESLNKAFGTTLRTYSVDGKKLHAPATPVSVPDSLSADVTAVAGLTTPTKKAPLNHRVKPDAAPSKAGKPSATKPDPVDCSNYWGQYQQTVPKVDGTTKVNTYLCGISPAQMRKVYGLDKAVANGQNGKGQTVAIIDAYANPTMLSDANRYSKSWGEPTFKKNQYTETKFSPFDLQDECGGEAGWNGEEALDVESVHAMAPGAKIHYIGAKNCDTGIDDALNFVIQNHTADIVSNSYGNTGEAVDPAEITLEHNLFMQAGAEGIGMYFSSGDDGDNVIDGLPPQPDYPASDPLVTSVGGTSELINKNGKAKITTGWETALDTIDYTGAKAKYDEKLPGSFWAGAGGGRSTVFSQPSYQKGTVPRKLSNNNGQQMRVSPDIAADADPYTGFYYALTTDGVYEQGAIGGTSLACPLIAGTQALASQNRKFAIGFANPTLYSLKDAAFRDVVPQGGPIRFASPTGSYTGTFEAGDTQKSRVGYDDITGRGVPNGKKFLKAEAN